MDCQSYNGISHPPGLTNILETKVEQLKLREIQSLTTYKSHLKTHLFKQSYSL